MLKITSGVDIVQIAEIKNCIEKQGERYLKRAFSPGEIAYCDSKPNKYQHYAVRFAAKEAVMKAVKTGWNNGVQWKNIEIVKNGEGAPSLNFSGRIKDILDESGFKHHDISLSHNQDYAVAFAIFY
ncbi:holo-ACP synthase [Mucilaginibacter sp. KACC 22773]|uniref:holo-ACP synthase n=1 Tax=Mucilaginibacter sp. KACC 22773 TaxID=3025671 RepID=UPI002365FC04|nr:holo-ACP synthase [Mucilaginibacter sp. KACC 22773]WDF77677.1 holo-ACP synthase [Mucilaginibacter sp. KACC 22773]